MAHPTEPPSVPFGQRLRALRERSGKTRTVLGGLVGRSPEWVKALETGRLNMPRLPMLTRLAEVLGVADLADLTGGQAQQRRHLSFGEHPSVPAIRDVVHRWPLNRPVDPPIPVEVLRNRADAAWRMWHVSRTRRTDVGGLLPELLADCRNTAGAADEQDRRAAHGVLSDVYALAQHALVNAAEPELQWLVAERSMAAAHVADAPVPLAGAAWTVAMMLRAAGRADEAVALVVEAAGLLESRLADAPQEWRGMWGALHLNAAVTEARAGRDGPAWAHWDRAAAAARRLPAGYHHPWTVFGPANVDLTAVSLTVDLWRSREALRRAESIDPDRIPSRERRGRLFVEMARGYSAAGERIATARLLLRACEEGVDAVRYSPAARLIVEDLLARPPAAVRGDVRSLAVRVGVDPP